MTWTHWERNEGHLKHAPHLDVWNYEGNCLW